MKKCVVFLGAPGSGKGTQARKIAKENLYSILSTGDLIRAEIRASTEIGQKSRPYIERGELIPDELMLDVVEEWVNASSGGRGIVSDGFPRTVSQAKALDHRLKQTFQVTILYLDVNLEEIKNRVLNRRICSRCNSIYNIVTTKPKKEFVCDKCGGKLIRRLDDTEEMIDIRYKTYLEQTKPILDFYGTRVTLINANKDAEDVYKEIIKRINE